MGKSTGNVFFDVFVTGNKFFDVCFSVERHADVLLLVLTLFPFQHLWHEQVLKTAATAQIQNISSSKPMQARSSFLRPWAKMCSVAQLQAGYKHVV